MIFIRVKASHTAPKYINKRVYWHYNKTLLVYIFSLKILHTGPLIVDLMLMVLLCVYT